MDINKNESGTLFKEQTEFWNPIDGYRIKQSFFANFVKVKSHYEESSFSRMGAKKFLKAIGYKHNFFTRSAKRFTQGYDCTLDDIAKVITDHKLTDDSGEAKSLAKIVVQSLVGSSTGFYAFTVEKNMQGKEGYKLERLSEGLGGGIA